MQCLVGMIKLTCIRLILRLVSVRAQGCPIHSAALFNQFCLAEERSACSFGGVNLLLPSPREGNRFEVRCHDLTPKFSKFSRSDGPHRHLGIACSSVNRSTKAKTSVASVKAVTTVLLTTQELWSGPGFYVIFALAGSYECHRDMQAWPCMSCTHV